MKGRVGTCQAAAAPLVALALGLAAGGCAEPRGSVPAASAPGAAREGAASSAPRHAPVASAVPAVGAAAASASAVPPGAATAPARTDALRAAWTRADMEAPPPVVPDCLGELSRAGVEAAAAQLPGAPRRAASRPPGSTSGAPACGAPEVVTYLRGPEGVVWSPRPVFTCGMALGLARFERLLVARARERLGSPVVRVTQLGTWACRRMARFAMPSEHSFANAIDLSAFHLQDGRRITVLHDFGSTKPEAPEPSTPGALFLREVARTAFDQALFSVVLTPYWDALHRDHFHLDLAPYRSDGTRP